MIRKSKDGSVEIHATEEVFDSLDRAYENSPEEIKRIDSWNGISIKGEMTVNVDKNSFDKLISEIKKEQKEG